MPRWRRWRSDVSNFQMALDAAANERFRVLHYGLAVRVARAVNRAVGRKGRMTRGREQAAARAMSGYCVAALAQPPPVAQAPPALVPAAQLLDAVVQPPPEP